MNRYGDITQLPEGQEVKHAKWDIKRKGEFKYHVCSECGFNGLVHKGYNKYNYCPYCGVKMDGETE